MTKLDNTICYSFIVGLILVCLLELQKDITGGVHENEVSPRAGQEQRTQIYQWLLRGVVLH